MVGKMILPTMGGTPAVWNTCMVFFQAILLAGYAYVHASVSLLGVRKQAFLQLLVLLSPLAVLPITLNLSSIPTSADNPVFWLLWKLVLGVGLPFFVVSTSAPLLQKWFSNTGHVAAKDPYFLYAASNLGSLLALLGYPVIMEPLLPLTDQTYVWAGGYLVLVALAFACAVAMWRASARTSDTAECEQGVESGVPCEISSEHVSIGRRLRWIALALAASSLMLGVTTHITTEIAPVPMLWVLPLALYLLTFVLVFARKPLIPHPAILKIFPFAIALPAILCVQAETQLGILPLPIHLLAFFVTAMACHGELARTRPSTRHLTEFYLWMSVGGVLGGLLNAIVAPMVFKSLTEYPAVMMAACILLALRKATTAETRVRVLDFVLPVVVGIGMAGLLHILWTTQRWDGHAPNLLTVGLPFAVCIIVRKRALRFSLCLCAILLAISIWYSVLGDESLYKGRNFYGTKNVTSRQNGQFHEFFHGKTNHGTQETHPKGRIIPKTYFHPTGPVGDIFRVFNAQYQRQNVGIVGLGVGSMASSIYAKADQNFTFYEIDPEVARIALNPELFTYIADCPAKCNVVLGDGRLTLAQTEDGHYGIIFLDAFSSDAVPTHLLTREALDLYLSKTNERGILVFNISNRYLDLAPVLGNLAEEAGLACLSKSDPANTEAERAAGKFPSRFLVMAKREQDIRGLEYNGWTKVPPRKDIGVWTDQYTNIFSIIDWH